MSRSPRVEVITGVERRRRFTDDEKRRIIEESLEAGASIAAVAKRYDLSPRLLYMWKSRLKRSGQLALPTRDENDSLQVGDFFQAATVAVAEDNFIRIHIQEQLVCDFPVSIDPRHLAAVVRILRA